jgi:hypothetical protein
MPRMLYQSGIILLQKVDDATNIPEIVFTNSWVKFAGRAKEKFEEKSEEVCLFPVA